MALLNLGGDPWLDEHEHCEKLHREIMEQLSLRQKESRSTEKFARMSSSIRFRLKQYNGQVNQLKEKTNQAARSRATIKTNRITTIQRGANGKMFNEHNLNLNQDRTHLLGATANWESDEDEFGAGEAQTLTVEQLKNQQKQMLEDQDKGLDSLSKIISKQKNIAQTISNEVDLQNDIIEDLGDHIDQTDIRVSNETRVIGTINRKDRTCVRYASACPEATIPISGNADYDVKTSTLSNKVFVAAAENKAAIARVGIVFRAGSRYETPDNFGTSHLLRIAAGTSTKGSTQFAITRNLQEACATLTCSIDRELVAYILEGTGSAVEKSLKYLREVATEQLFHHWEISDNMPRVRLELATRSPQLRAVDLLHKAAYRGRTLGNSLYIPKHNLGKIKSEHLQSYVDANFTSNKAAVVGLGISHKDLKGFAETLDLQTGCDRDVASVYAGGEIRSDKGGPLAHIAVAGQGGPLTNGKEALAFAILQRALGSGTYIKYTNERNAPFSKLLGSSPEPNLVTALNISYSDSGLFGALITSTSTKAGFFLESVMSILKSGTISDEDFVRGKTQLKNNVLYSLENGSNGIEEMITQAGLLKCVATPAQVICAIDEITKEDVEAAAKKVACSKFSIASIGTLHCVPFLDEIAS
ncbi:hypothetical protein FQR65_LT07711 [Abscondita terminalis]|nr:hypothetical protein FQR65_LT07711 [Abscondita terminalis]